MSYQRLSEFYRPLKSHLGRHLLVLASLFTFSLLAVVGGARAGDDRAVGPAPTPTPIPNQVVPAETVQETTSAGSNAPQVFTREGLQVKFEVTALTRTLASGQLSEADQAEVRFTVTDAHSGEPVSGLYPAVWMDIAESFDLLHGKGGQTLSCRDRVGVYLQGVVGARPLIDLNSYFVLVLNQDPSITVIDPIIGIQGRTNMYAQVLLKRAGADWAKSEDEKQLFVSMPVADMVAVVDLEQFTVTHNILAGDNPQRVVLQNDGRYLWVGNDSDQADASGVTVIDAWSLGPVKFIPTGRGHHEIVLSSDDRYAFVTNRDGGTVTVIDVRSQEKVQELDAGGKPIALAYSALSDALYIADGESGTITVVDGKRLEVVQRIATQPGLGPLRFSRDGRWAVAVNPHHDEAYVIDAADNRLKHTIAMEGRPFHIAFSDAFAYVRALDSEFVKMINLKELDRRATALVTKFEAGKAAPGKVRDLPIADLMVPAPGEASMLVSSPADLTVYYYMEGMNAPMGNFRNYGHRPRAVSVVDRTLKERQPGQYSAKVKIPAAGRYDVVFLLDTPRLLHCFEAIAAVNPYLEKDLPALTIEYLTKERKIKQGGAGKVRFKLTDPQSGQPRSDLHDVYVRYYNTSGRQRGTLNARSVGEGIYEADLTLLYPGAYYLWVSTPALEVDYRDLKYFSLLSVPDRSRLRGQRPDARPVDRD